MGEPFTALNPNLWSEEVAESVDRRLRNFETRDRENAVEATVGSDWLVNGHLAQFGDIHDDAFDKAGITRATQTPFKDAVQELFYDTWNDHSPDSVWWNAPTEDNPTMRMPTRDRIPRWQREEQTKFLNQLLEDHDPGVRQKLYEFAAKAPDDTRAKMLSVLNVPAGTIMDMVKFYEKLIQGARDKDAKREELLPCINALLKLENWRGYTGSMPSKVIEFIENGGQPGSFVNELNHLLTRTYRQLSFYIRDHQELGLNLETLENPRITAYMNKRRRRMQQQAREPVPPGAEVAANVETLVEMLRSTRFLPRAAREVIARVLTQQASNGGGRQNAAANAGLNALLGSGVLSQEAVAATQLTRADEQQIEEVATQVVQAIQDKIEEQQERDRTRSPRVTVEQVRADVRDKIELVTESTMARVRRVLSEVDTKLKQKMNPNIVDVVFNAINQALSVSEPGIKAAAVADATAEVTLAGTQPQNSQGRIPSSPNRRTLERQIAEAETNLRLSAENQPITQNPITGDFLLRENDGTTRVLDPRIPSDNARVQEFVRQREAIAGFSPFVEGRGQRPRLFRPVSDSPSASSDRESEFDEDQ